MPFRIGIGAALVLVVAYFLVLKPKDDAPSTPATAPGVAGLTNAVGKAKDAAATSDAANQEAGGTIAAPATPAPATGAPATAAPATPVAKPTSTAAKALADLAPGDRSARILREIAHGRTAVMLFSTPGAAEDVHVRRALAGIDPHHGAVRVHRVSLSDVARYDTIARGVEITQAPTLLVIGADLKAHRIVGYTDRTEINQLVNDVSGLRTRLRPSSYHSLFERGCGTSRYNLKGDGLSLSDRHTRFLAFRDDVQALSARLKAAHVPAGLSGFNAQYVSLLRQADGQFARFLATPTENVYEAVTRQVAQLDDRMASLAKGAGLECVA